MGAGALGSACSRAGSWHPKWMPEAQDPHHTPYMDANVEADVDTSRLDARPLRLIMQVLSHQDLQDGSVMLDHWDTPHSDAHL